MLVWSVLGCGVAPQALPTAGEATAREVLRSSWTDVSRTHERGWVGLRGELRGTDADCVVAWRGLAVDGEGTPVRSVSGETFVGAGEVVSVTGLVSDDPERSASVAAAELEVVDARCGDGLPDPHAGRVQVATLQGGDEDGLPYVEVRLTPEAWGPPRCVATLVVQGLDDTGLPVRHDERPVSLRPGADRVVRVPLTDRHSGRLDDTEPQVDSLVAWVEGLTCLPAAAPAGDPELDADITTWRATDAALPFEVAVWPTFELGNPLAEDCAFVVEAAAVDWSGRALGTAAWTVHLPGGAQRTWTPRTPLGIWEDLAEDLAILRITRAERHLGRCDGFDAARAL
jgi:hypothetical protein